MSGAALRRATLQIARPVRDLERSAAMYREGLGLAQIGGFRAPSPPARGERAEEVA